MSKNFEVLRQAGWAQEYFDQQQIEQGPKPTHQHAAYQRTERPKLGNDPISKLVQGIYLSSRYSAPGTVAFAGVGKETVSGLICASASKILASQIDRRVCVLDANFARPSLHRCMNQLNRSGFSDAITDSKRVTDFAIQISANLWMLTAGSKPNGFGLPNSTEMASRLHELRSAFDFLLIDCRPIASGADAISIGQQSHGVILVVDPLQTSAESVVQAKRRLEINNVRLLAVVMNQQARNLPPVLDRLFQ